MDWSYIAGFFDGEGNIKVNKISDKEGPIKSYQIAIRFYNSNLELLNKIKDFIGYGAIYSSKKKPPAGIVHELTITKKSHVREVLQKLSEYSHDKKGKINFILKNFDFSRNNNLSFDLNGFYKLTTRKNVEKFYVSRPLKKTNRLTE